jgi:hypothetical protein
MLFVSCQDTEKRSVQAKEDAPAPASTRDVATAPSSLQTPEDAVKLLLTAQNENDRDMLHRAMLRPRDSYQFSDVKHTSYEFAEIDTLSTKEKAGKFVNARRGDMRILAEIRWEHDPDILTRRVYFVRKVGGEWQVTNYSTINGSR